MNVLTELKEGLGISWGAIRANKMRSVLTTLGIVIGIVTVTLMASAIQGLDRAFLKNISFIGTDVLYVSRFNWFIDSEEEWRKVQKRRPITAAQARALEKHLTLARAVVPEVDAGLPIYYKKRRSDSVRVVGTTDQFVYTSSTAVALGRFLSPLEAEGGRPVCVIGSEVATNLFRREPPLGNRVRIGGQSFEVIGVLEKQGRFLGLVSLDNQVIIPLKQFMMAFWSNPDCQIRVKVAELAQLDDAKEEVRSAMRVVRRLAPKDPDDFAINQQDQFVKMFHKLGGTIAAVGLFVTGLSLFVGGIGIMNIMFVSVAERTREIGIRKAIGAKRRTILLQFLIEAACICLMGGTLALGLAWLLILVVQKFLPAALSPSIVGLALLVSLVTGVVSGFLPAWRAALMNPVDALRNE
ncbi:MAG: ABC transporter permease [Verrucomicrobiota bacterium]|jgi:putative ABC transport system permease protein